MSRTQERPPPREYRDRIGKRLFASARLIEDMLRGYLPPELVGEVDYSTLTRHPPEILARDGLLRIPDVLWTAERPDGGRLAVLIELQTKVETNMAASNNGSSRVARTWGDREAVASMAAETALLRENMPEDLQAEGGRHPSILPVVVYCGDGEWTAAEGMAAGADADDPLAAEFLGRRSYVALDAVALRREDVPERNRMAVFGRVRAGEDAPEMVRELRRSFEWIGEDELQLRTALLDWMHANCRNLRVTPEVRREMEKLEPEKEAEMLEDAIRRWGEKQAEQGHKRGMDHERRLLLRQAAHRFGPDAGDRLAAQLADVADPSRLDQVGDLIVDCATGNELLARLNGRPRA